MRQRGTATTSNPEPIVQQLPCESQNLLAYVTGPDAGSQTVYTVELTLFRRLLALVARSRPVSLIPSAKTCGPPWRGRRPL